MRRLFILSIFFMVLALGAGVVTPDAARAQFLTAEDRTRLEAEYAKIQAEIAEWEGVLAETRSKKASLQGDVDALNALINKATAEIKQRNVSITKITNEIALKEATIQELEEKLRRGQISLANILRIKNVADDRSLAELVLSTSDFGSFFGQLDALSVVQRDLNALFQEIRTLKDGLEVEKDILAAEQNRELDARYEVELTKRQVAKNEAAQKELLNIEKTKEKTYEEVLSERQRRAQQIQNALFPLRDVEGISFAVALDHAAYAEEKTGVRAALILAILSQESDLGKNVGSCFVTSLQTGDGIGKNTGTEFEQVMKAPRDTEPFERITEDLGLTWGATPVSCPLGKTYYSGRGFGGAMGPSQFIPSTWVLYEPSLKKTLGVGLPNPWDPKHAIMATALLMKDNGAAGGTYTAELNAACRYYSGGTCASRGSAVTSYGKSVVGKAEAFQEDIDFLKGI